MQLRSIHVLSIVVFTVFFSTTSVANKKFKSCVEGVTGMGYSADVNWYEADSIRITSDNIDLGTPVKSTTTTVWTTDCHSSNKPLYTTVRAIGNSAAATVVGWTAGIGASVAGMGLCVAAGVAAAPVTGGASIGAAGVCVQFMGAMAPAASETIRLQLPDKGTFFSGFASHIEIDGTVFDPEAKITKRMKGLYESHSVDLHSGMGLEDALTKNNIKVAIFNGDTKLVEETIKGIGINPLDLRSYHKKVWAHVVSKKVTHIEVSTDGDDAFFLDYLVVGANWSGKVYQWGKPGHGGWCLSTDKKDGKSWKKGKNGYSISKNAGCQRKWTFHVGNTHGFY